MDFTKVQETFPELGSRLLCKLAEIVEISPSKVLELVPEAAPSQIAKFLSIAEAAIEPENNKVQRKMPKVSRRSVTPGDQDAISLLGQLKQLPAKKPEKIPELASPTEERSEFMDALRKLVPPKDKGSESALEQFSEYQKKILSLLGASKTPTKAGVEHFEQIYEKLQTDPLARSCLENLHAARAHKYGHAHLGPKSWYKESTSLSTKLKSQADRRKFRAGLKGLIDFLNQLNIMDLERAFQKGESEGFNLLKMPVQIYPETFCKHLKNVPPMKLIEFVNAEKAADIRKLISKISSLAHFSQSMADYYAHDDALEPALAAVCEALRNHEDVGAVLDKRAATFLSLAQPYDKLRSEADHDARRAPKSKNTAERRPSRNPRQLHCFRFQRGSCRIKNCDFKHECRHCGSRGHGKIDCPKKKSKSRERKSRD